MSNDTENVPKVASTGPVPSNRKSNFNEIVRKFLEKDQYGLFKTKSKRVLEENISRTDTKIQRLLDLKSKSEQINRNLTTKGKDLKLKNNKLKEELLLQLRGSK